MTSTNPKERLARVLHELADDLPDIVGPVFAASRFAAGSAALAAFSDKDEVHRAVAGIDDVEADHLADLLLSRRARLEAASSWC